MRKCWRMDRMDDQVNGRWLQNTAEVLVMNFSFPVIILDEVLKFFGRQYSQHNDEPRRILRSTNSVVQSSFRMVFACLGDSLSVQSNSTHFISFVLIYVTSKKNEPPKSITSHKTSRHCFSPHLSCAEHLKSRLRKSVWSDIPIHHSCSNTLITPGHPGHLISPPECPCTSWGDSKEDWQIWTWQKEMKRV